ncbi:MAG: hypothetical protein AAGK04_04315, partial [Planctomycetota bacterium]
MTRAQAKADATTPSTNAGGPTAGRPGASADDAARAHAEASHAVRPQGKRKRRLPAWTHGPAYVGLRAALTLPLAAGPRTSLEVASKVGRAFAASKGNR